jgi:hypothetical protein
MSRPKSAAAAIPKHAPEVINKKISRKRSKSKLGLRVTMKKAHMPDIQACRMHLLVVIRHLAVRFCGLVPGHFDVRASTLTECPQELVKLARIGPKMTKKRQT